MAYKLFNSKGDLIGAITHINMQSGEPTTITLGTGHELLFNPDDIYLDSNRDAHIRKSGSFHRIANDSYDSHCYANQAKEILNATYGKRAAYTIKKVIFNPPATIVYWSDGSKTVVKCSEKDVFDPEKGLAMAVAKRCGGNNGSYYKEIRNWVEKSGKRYPESPTAGKAVNLDALKKYISEANKDFEKFLITATSSKNQSSALLRMTALVADLKALELEINK